MLGLSFICLTITFGAFGYLSTDAAKDPYMSAMLLDELVERMGKGLADSDPYIQPMPENIPSRLSLMARATKDLEGEQLDYDTLLKVGNPNPSLRDQEYSKHSTLWGHRDATGGMGGIGGPNWRPKQYARLPAYCNPPNPCPVGYTEDQGCKLSSENTAEFSRDYQAAQRCMCDDDHMFDCPGPEDDRQMNSGLESYLARQFQTGSSNSDGAGDKNLVSKKYQPSYRSLNPYLSGEKSSIAAKKGDNAY